MRFEKFAKILLILAVFAVSTSAFAAENDNVSCNALTDRQTSAPASSAQQQNQQQQQSQGAQAQGAK